MPTIGWLRWSAAHRPEELGVTEGEDAAVGGDQPVAEAVGGGGDADDRCVQGRAAGRAVEAGVAEGEDPTVGGDQPVAVAVRRRGHADHRLVEVIAPAEPSKGECP